jgi:sporulation protein YlmC with PRC-barrel domain
MELIGCEVVNRQGRELGRIAELVIDIDLGRVAAAVLTVGEKLHSGERLVAIPAETLTLRASDRRPIIDVDKELMDGAPSFMRASFPTHFDRAWLASTYEHFGFGPYWDEERTPEDAATGTG